MTKAKRKLTEFLNLRTAFTKLLYFMISLILQIIVTSVYSYFEYDYNIAAQPKIS